MTPGVISTNAAWVRLSGRGGQLPHIFSNGKLHIDSNTLATRSVHWRLHSYYWPAKFFAAMQPPIFLLPPHNPFHWPPFPFSVIFGPFWQFSVIFGPIWVILGHFWAIFWCCFFVAKYASVLFKSLFATLSSTSFFWLKMPEVDQVHSLTSRKGVTR